MAASRQQSQRRTAAAAASLWVAVACVAVCGVGGARDHHYEGQSVQRRKILLDGQMQRSRHPPTQGPRWQRSDRPNIIMIITDDQDLLLGMGRGGQRHERVLCGQCRDRDLSPPLFVFFFLGGGGVFWL